MSELIGAELAAAVADAEGVYWFGDGDLILTHGIDGPGSMQRYSPSTDWSQGGPIIERERVSVCADFSHPADGAVVFRQWFAEMPTGKEGHGPTPLIAAMRAFVASKA